MPDGEKFARVGTGKIPPIHAVCIIFKPVTDLCPAARTVQIDPICDTRGNALTGQDVAGQGKARDRARKRRRQQGLYLVDITIHEDFLEYEIGQGFVIR